MSYIYGLLKGAISALLHLMYSLTGNFGVAIILATIVIKIIFFCVKYKKKAKIK